MKKVLMFAALAGIAAAVSIYFVTESNKTPFYSDEDDDYYVSDADIEAYNMQENTGPAQPI